MPVHKTNERTFGGKSRLYCLGEHKDPDSLTREQTLALRETHRDDDGWLIRAVSS